MQYIPKSTKFEEINQQKIKEIQQKINNRPRRKLNFCSPKEIFFVNLQEKVALRTFLYYSARDFELSRICKCRRNCKKNLFEIYFSVADTVLIYDNTGGNHIFVARKDLESDVDVIDNHVYNKILKAYEHTSKK